MSRIKILLGDPRHSTVGEHSNFVPIGIGYIATNLLKQFENYNLELKIETKTEEILALLETWKPNIVGLSHYVWNKSLSNFMCSYTKKINPDSLCVLGGPEFPAGTEARSIENNDRDKTYDKCLSYLINKSSVDYFAYSDGEVTFLEIVRNYIKNNCAIRLSIGPPPLNPINLPKNYKFIPGQGSILIDGFDGIIFSYGQTMVNQAFKACRILKKENINLKLINMPCINNFSLNWFKKNISKTKNIFFLEDHNINGGISDLLTSFITNNKILNNAVFTKFGPNEFPACGTPGEVLKYHKLDEKSLSLKIKKEILI